MRWFAATIVVRHGSPCRVVRFFSTFCVNTGGAGGVILLADVRHWSAIARCCGLLKHAANGFVALGGDAPDAPCLTATVRKSEALRALRARGRSTSSRKS